MQQLTGLDHLYVCEERALTWQQAVKELAEVVVRELDPHLRVGRDSLAGAANSSAAI